MSQGQAFERVARLADGDLDPGEANSTVDLILSSPEWRMAWQEIHVVGDCLRSDEMGAVCQDGGFMARFTARLEEEPTILAPSRVTDQGHRRRWLRYGLPGASAAAAVAMVAWIAFPQLSNHPIVASHSAPAQVQAVAVSTRAASQQPVIDQPVLVNQQSSSTKPVDPNRLREYLEAHQQFATTAIRSPGYVQAADLTIVAPETHDKP